MGASCHIFYVFALLISKVSLDVIIQSSVGKSVFLPCLYTEDHVQSVLWLHNDKNVYLISPNKDSQEILYNSRAESFPKEYGKGNYSIKISQVVISDDGEYACLITPANQQKNVRPVIIEGKENKFTEAAKERRQIGPWAITGIVIAVLIVICGVGFLLIMRQKRMWICKSPSNV